MNYAYRLTGVEGMPVFETREDYERFYRGYCERVVPALRGYVLAHAKSEERARKHWVD
jgi:hypothetical protein